MTSWLRDLRLALRGLARSPLFSIAAVTCLALGIAACTAVFSLLSAILLEDLPFREADGLIFIRGQIPEQGLMRLGGSAAEFLDLSEQTTTVAQVAAAGSRYLNLTEGDEPARLVAARVSPQLFSLLDVAAARGTTLQPQHAQEGEHRVAVLSDGLWRRRFGGDPGIVGRKIVLNDEPFTVVGVMPASFAFRYGNFEHELWVPVVPALENPKRDFRALNLVARLAPGATLEEARAELALITERLRAEYPDVYAADFSFVPVPVKEELVGNYQLTLWVLFAAVFVVLLIACANVANLMLARAAARSKEVALRSALGAGRGRLVRERMVEGLVLSLLGGGLGLLLAAWGVRAVVASELGGLPRLPEVRLDGAVLAFGLVLSLATGLGLSLIPALQASRSDLQTVLREAGSNVGGSGGGRRLRAALVVAEIALSLLLVTGAGLLVRSLLELRSVDPGFDSANLLTAQLYLPRTEYRDDARRAAFAAELEESLRTLPGVRSAALINSLPLGALQIFVGAELEGYQPQPGEAEPYLEWRVVSPGYFDTLGIRLADGRDFSRLDTPESALAVIVDEGLARRFWPGQRAVGRRLKLLRGGGDHPWRTVVGVVAHTKTLGLDAGSREQVYSPFSQTPVPPVSMALRTLGEPLSQAAALRRAVWQVDRDLPVEAVRPMTELVEESMSDRRSYAVLLGAFAGVALLLAMIGVYGVMAYSVALRRHEIAIRLAVGAPTRDVFRLVLGRALLLAGIGVACGLGLALGASRLVGGLLYGVSGNDGATLAGVATLLLALSLLAAYAPARRAMRVSPSLALKEP